MGNIITLKTQLESKVQTHKVEEVAINNLKALSELLTLHEVSYMRTAPQKQDQTYGAGDLEKKTWYKNADPLGAPGIALVVDSLIRLIAILDDEDNAKIRAIEIVRALYHLGITDVFPEVSSKSTQKN